MRKYIATLNVVYFYEIPNFYQTFTKCSTVDMKRKAANLCTRSVRFHVVHCDRIDPSLAIYAFQKLGLHFPTRKRYAWRENVSCCVFARVGYYFYHYSKWESCRDWLKAHHPRSPTLLFVAIVVAQNMTYCAVATFRPRFPLYQDGCNSFWPNVSFRWNCQLFILAKFDFPGMVFTDCSVTDISLMLIVHTGWLHNMIFLKIEHFIYVSSFSSHLYT